MAMSVSRQHSLVAARLVDSLPIAGNSDELSESDSLSPARRPSDQQFRGLCQRHMDAIFGPSQSGAVEGNPTK